MPCSRQQLSRFAGLVSFLALGLAVPAHAAEPQVDFTLDHGWVKFRVRQDGKPVAGAVLAIIDERGTQFGEGETGADGDCEFLMPAGSSCVVEVKTGKRTADPIRLLKTDAGIEPARVLLSYGLRPCCRSVRIRPKAVSAEVPGPPIETKGSYDPLALLAIVFFGLGGAAAFWSLKRRHSTPPGVSAKMNA